MGYTRKQLNEAIQAVENLGKERFKSNPVAMTLGVAAPLGVAVGISAGVGALAGLALSSAGLPPLIAGGIFGFATPLVLTPINACCS